MAPIETFFVHCSQVAGQQGAYVARMVNRGYSLGKGGMDMAPPLKVEDPEKVGQAARGVRKNVMGIAEGAVLWMTPFTISC